MSEGGGLHHPVVFVELAVPDLAAAARFYRTALAWDVHDVADDDGHRTVLVRCLTGAKPNLGLVEGVAGPGGARPFLLTDDLAHSQTAWRDAGGRCGEPSDFVGLGRRCTASDPWGNEVVLWEWSPGRGWTPDSS